MDLQLSDKIALITGASAGIGRATALLLAAEGAQVALCARRRDLLLDVADEIEKAGGKPAVIIEADLVEHDAAQRIADTVRRELGRLDILVSVAGGSEPTGLELTEDVWLRQFELNFHSKRRLSQATLGMLMDSDAGRIVNFVGLLEPNRISPSQAAVAACITWAKGLSREVAKSGLTVNCIAPGRVDSEQLRRLMPPGEETDAFIRQRIPAGRFGTPEEAAALVAFLVSGPASYITGNTFSVDGGMHWSI